MSVPRWLSRVVPPAPGSRILYRICCIFPTINQAENPGILGVTKRRTLLLAL